MSVFGMHFDKVLNNHRPVDRSVLDLMVIDNPISFTEVKQSHQQAEERESTRPQWDPPRGAQSNGQRLMTNSPPSRMPLLPG
jgi:hypothetical protein